MEDCGMATWRDESFQRELHRLLKLVRRRAAEPPVFDPPFIQRLSPNGATYVLQGDDLRRLRSLERRLAGSSRRTHGLSREEAQTAILEACDLAVVSSIPAAA